MKGKSSTVAMNVAGVILVVPGAVLSYLHENWVWLALFAVCALMLLHGAVQAGRGKKAFQWASLRAALLYALALTLLPLLVAVVLFVAARGADTEQASRLQGLAVAALLLVLLFGSAATALALALRRQSKVKANREG